MYNLAFYGHKVSSMNKLVLILLILGSSNLISAADIKAGETKAAMCASCHGKNGVGISDMFPNVAGQKAGYTSLQLKAFRDGQRKNAMMSPMAQSLTDQDIENIAAYYASLPAAK